MAEALSKGRFGKHNDIFELTKSGTYHPLIARFAEAFGMMAVKIEAREFQLGKIIEELRQSEAELRIAREDLSRENTTLKKNLLLEPAGNKTDAAERLGMSREVLRKKLKRMGIS